jgi:hypothetical protein
MWSSFWKAISMNETFEFTEKEREEFDRRLENGFEFVREIFDDPSILGRISSGSTVESIPKRDRDPAMQYDIETPRMLAIVTPGGMDTPPSAKQANGHPRRIQRDEATRLKRIRAAHR